MTTDPDSIPSGDSGGGIELPILSDPGLAAQGWQRRHMVDGVRAAESVELYESLGFEVRVVKVDPAQFGPQCAPCVADGGDSSFLIYTRKPRRAR